MANSEEKISKFVQAITAYAEEQRDKIHEETERFKADRLQKAEQDVLSDVYHLIQKETAAVRGEGIREISRRDLAARKALLGRRSEIADDVFRRVKDKVIAFTESSDYNELLCGLMKQLVDVLPAEGTVYAIGPHDEIHLQELSSLCPVGSRIEVSDTICLGGIRGENMARGITADNTLDSRLLLERDRFPEWSGLTLD